MESMSAVGGLTYADLAAFPDDDNLRRELLDGELLVSPSPNRRHQQIAARLHLAFADHLRAHGGGECYFAPFDVVFSERTVLEPDLMFIGDDRAQILTDANVQGVPTLVIEILSDPRRDRVMKLEAYERFGVPEYWIVDPDADLIEIYRLGGDGRYGRATILLGGDQLTTPILPGFAIDLSELLARG